MIYVGDKFAVRSKGSVAELHTIELNIHACRGQGTLLKSMILTILIAKQNREKYRVVRDGNNDDNNFDDKYCRYLLTSKPQMSKLMFMTL